MQAKTAEELTRNREKRRIEQLARACRVEREKVQESREKIERNLSSARRESASSISLSCGFKEVKRLNLKLLL